jgi:hypothetical protein
MGPGYVLELLLGYAECHYAECPKFTLYAVCCYAECHDVEYRYAECHYDKCRYAKCGSTLINIKAT